MPNPSYNQLSAEERFVIEGKGTEQPFTGEYDDFYEEVSMSAGGATPNSIDPSTSSTLVAAGRRSIKRFQGP